MPKLKKLLDLVHEIKDIFKANEISISKKKGILPPVEDDLFTGFKPLVVGIEEFVDQARDQWKVKA